jgi:hypothetical protein
MRSEFRNVFATEEGAALEWTTQGTSNGDSVAYDGVSILEIEGANRFVASWPTSTPAISPPSRGLITAEPLPAPAYVPTCIDDRDVAVRIFDSTDPRPCKPKEGLF